MDDLLSEFLNETGESLGLLDSELVRLEQNPEDPTLLGNIFRLVHTIKGTCGFLGLPRLERVAHAAENVLGQVRDGSLAVTPEAISLVLEALDAIKAILHTLSTTEKEPDGDDAPLIARLAALAAGEEAQASSNLQDADSTDFEPVMVHDPIPEAVIEPAVTQPAPDPVPTIPIPTPEIPSAPAPEQARDVASQTIRVHVDLLEDLMTTVSELVLTRNQLLQILRATKDSEFTTPLQRLSQVTSELQEGVMKTRMQPIGNAWGKLPRLVRDLARELGKKLELRMIGAETELDRQVLEMVKDPLTHMVRNCADHGIELPAERAAAGKPETGTIILDAHHEGGHIVVAIRDDGRGLAVDKIRAKVLANGLATEAEVAAMTDQQLHQFIFRAGFSTAAKVTNVSGRGVGMDVVRTNIEKIGGTVEVRSEPGKGSAFVIKIPLTLAIVSALIVECAGERFAIPQINVLELVRAAGNSEHRIEMLYDAPVLRLRDRILPLVSLEVALGRAADVASQTEAYVIVTQVGHQTFGIMVDRVFDTEEIVVKPVAPMLRDVAVYSGNTILGDGSVIMILDPNGLAAQVGSSSVEETASAAQSSLRAAAEKERQSVILFRAGGPEIKAVPLSLVARLEVIDRSQIERANGTLVVQYRGRLMPLAPIDPMQETGSTGRQPILVFAEDERNIGLMVDEIVDIVAEDYAIELASQRPGVLGSAVIAGKATDVIDVSHHLAQASEGWNDRTQALDYGETQGHRRVLLVDDSPLFRNMIEPVLSVAGYDVTAASSADDALRLCEKGVSFDVIVSDIEMPKTDGLRFAEQVRESDGWQGTPLIALTSHVTQRDRERSLNSGFCRHVAKFDRQRLLEAISETLSAERGAA